MKIRRYATFKDRDHFREMHKQQGHDYVFPNFDHPEFFSGLVVENDAGKPVMALMGRVTCEMFLLMYPDEGTPKDRLSNFLTLHEASEKEVWHKGLQDAHCFVPPGTRMDKFKKLLRLLGWVPATQWECWTKPQLSGHPKMPTLGSLKSFIRGGEGNGQT